MSTSLNLARRPFLNSRPVQRAGIALWIGGALLLVSNVSLFWAYLNRSADQRAELAELNREIAAERAAVADLEARFSGLDLTAQNEQIEFLNGKIAERTFLWSQLLDRIAAVLPDDVRLVSLEPRQQEGRSRSTARPRGDDDGRVRLSIAGQSRSDTALMQFVDNLFRHPAFGEPNPTRKRRREEDDLVDFELTVGYRPAGVLQPAIPAPLAPPGAATAPAPTDEAEQR
jgi:Tfp pilus assembly protein PilN